MFSREKGLGFKLALSPPEGHWFEFPLVHLRGRNPDLTAIKLSQVVEVSRAGGLSMPTPATTTISVKLFINFTLFIIISVEVQVGLADKH